MKIGIQSYTNTIKNEWDEFVINSKATNFCHLSTWLDIMKESFGHDAIYLYARRGEKIVGILPMIQIKNIFFGNFMSSLPFLDYGGVCARQRIVQNSLVNQAINLAQQKGVNYLELKHTERLKLGLSVSTSKVSMILTLPENSSILWQRFSAKVRNQIRKAQKKGLIARFGGAEMVDDFYSIFPINMRNLGTPVYSKKFFRNIFLHIPVETKLCTVYYNNQPISSSMILAFKNKIHVPWASSTRKHIKLAPNMLLYWTILAYASDNGYNEFDFGRCTPGSGTFRFKNQWGSAQKQLYLHYWSSDDKRISINSQKTKLKYAINIWKRLPLPIANTLGPFISKRAGI